MNEFAAKKLGEVLAFARVALDTGERGKAALQEAFSAGELEGFLMLNQNIEQNILGQAASEGVSDIVLAKAEKTGAKLIAMRDMYIGDEWDNPAELLEWSGFFFGAAIVHWQLVVGVANKLRPELVDSAEKTVAIYERALESAKTAIQRIAEEKA